MSDPFVGKLTYFRVYSGKLNSGSYVLNASTGRKERVGRLLEMHANHREDVEQIGAGAIAAAVGLKQTTTGDTLCDPDAPVLLESIDFPDPVIDVAVEPKTKADQDKLTTALQRLAEEDPTFRVRTNEETGQTIIAGMGELHLEIIVDRLMREFKVDANVGRPQVAYRETIRNAVHGVHGRFVRQSGGRGQYGDVVIDMEPNEPGAGYEFEQQDRGRRDPPRVHLVDRRRHQGGDGGGRAGRLPGGRHQGHAGRRLLPRRGLLGDGLQGGRLDGLQGGLEARQAGAARARHGGRGGHARGLHG